MLLRGVAMVTMATDFEDMKNPYSPPLNKARNFKYVVAKMISSESISGEDLAKSLTEVMRPVEFFNTDGGILYIIFYISCPVALIALSTLLLNLPRKENILVYAYYLHFLITFVSASSMDLAIKEIGRWRTEELNILGSTIKLTCTAHIEPALLVALTGVLLDLEEMIGEQMTSFLPLGAQSPPFLKCDEIELKCSRQ